jgi:hypothetical protein
MLTTATMNNSIDIPPPQQIQRHPLMSPHVTDFSVCPTTQYPPPHSIMYEPSSTSFGSVEFTLSTTSFTPKVHNHKRGRQGSEASSESVQPYHYHQQQQQRMQQQLQHNLPPTHPLPTKMMTTTKNRIVLQSHRKRPVLALINPHDL